jgi:hypothetical protein
VNEALELELRQLPGVWFVSFSEGDGTTFIELVVSPATEHLALRQEAVRAAVNHLEGPAEVRVFTPEGAGGQPAALERGERVGLQVVLPTDGEAAIEVQLTRGEQRYASRATAGDTLAVGRAVLQALRGLGTDVPFDVVGLYALPSDWGAGLIAVVRNIRTGELRRGVANGDSPADAAARAVLHALNRSI